MAHFAKQNTKFGGGGKARAGKNSFPQTPFLFARPSFKNSLKFRVWIFFEKSSDFVQNTEPNCMFGVCCLSRHGGIERPADAKV
ncbi:MAG: hypothetical protein PHE11_05510 [Candidatus Omnitrophica bacterium]|jgi:hypothetical protein|nr:hypothetical protein [Candidatus Omnitrophota bacterium]MDD5526841.1 hypothetical protein [Candidatus Omnitrophota bacterium]